MKNLLNLVKERTNELNSKEVRKSFNTNDFLLEILIDKKINRSEVIDIILNKRMELAGFTEESISNIKKGSKEETELIEVVKKLYKTSKNGLDTSVSDSNNNSSFSYNPSYSQYKLIKEGNTLEIKKISK